MKVDYRGFFRGDKLQALIADESESEFKSYKEWYEWAKQYVTIVPEKDRRIPVLEALPSDIYEDIFTTGKTYWVKKTYSKTPIEYSRDILLSEIQVSILPEVEKRILSNKTFPKITLDDFIIPQKEFTYKPCFEYDSERYYNSFKLGFIKAMKFDNSVKEIPSEFDKLLNNLADEKAKHWLINHMSTWLHLFLAGFQYNGRYTRIETIPIFYGEQGTGKNTIMKYFSEAIEEGGYIEVSKEMFSSQFNSWMLNSVILMNEFSENREVRKASSAAIKLLTSPYTVVNEKGMKPYKIDNVAYIAFACNTSDYSAFDVESGDRRLQFISGGKNLNARKHNLCDMQLLENQKYDFINYLLNYEWDFEQANAVYDDEIKLAEKEANKSPMQYLVDSILEEEDLSTITVQKVKAKADYEGIKISVRSIGQYLTKRFGQRKPRKIAGKIHWYYSVSETGKIDSLIHAI